MSRRARRRARWRWPASRPSPPTSTPAAPLPVHPRGADRGEHLARQAPRPRGPADRPRARRGALHHRGDRGPARVVGPGARAPRARPFLATIPVMLSEGNGAMRQIARLAELGDVRAMHAEVVDRTRRSAEEVLMMSSVPRMTEPHEHVEPQGGREPTQEEMAALLADRLARTPVRDVLLQCMATFIDMAGVRLGMGPTGDDARDLAQARQAIEALRALLGVAERELGAAQVRPFQEPLAVLQMAFSRASEERRRTPRRTSPAAAARRARRRPRASGCHRARPGRKAPAESFPGSGRLGPCGRKPPWSSESARTRAIDGTRSAGPRSGVSARSSSPDLGGINWPTSCRTTQHGSPWCSASWPSPTASASRSTCSRSRPATSRCGRSPRRSRRALRPT